MDRKKRGRFSSTPLILISPLHLFTKFETYGEEDDFSSRG